MSETPDAKQTLETIGEMVNGYAADLITAILTVPGSVDKDATADALFRTLMTDHEMAFDDARNAYEAAYALLS